MARTISEIFNEMSAEKDALTQTANLTPAGSTFSGLMDDIFQIFKITPVVL